MIRLTVYAGKYIMVNVRKVIQRRLKQMKRTRFWLSQEVGLRPATVYDYLNGKAKIMDDKIEAMLTALDLEIRPKE